MAPKILVVLTSAGSSPDGSPTGWYLPELAHPYEVLATAGATFTFASPKGGKAPLDPASIAPYKDDLAVSSFLANHSDLWENTVPLRTLAGKAADFDAIFYPGGQGPMFDLVDDAESQALIAEFYALGRPVAAVCHGVAAFVDVKLSNGQFLLQGKEATGFSNAEEEAVGKMEVLPFLLEDRLGEVTGGKYVLAPELWGEKVVVDGLVITGQNPKSAKGVGVALAKALGLKSQ